MAAVANAKLLNLTNTQAAELAGKRWNVNGSLFRFKPYKPGENGNPPWRRGGEGIAYPLLGADSQPAVYLKFFHNPNQQRLDRTAWLIGQEVHSWIPQLSAAPWFWADTRIIARPSDINFHFSGCMAKAVPGLTWLEVKWHLWEQLRMALNESVTRWGQSS